MCMSNILVFLSTWGAVMLEKKKDLDIFIRKMGPVDMQWSVIVGVNCHYQLLVALALKFWQFVMTLNVANSLPLAFLLVQNMFYN